MEYTNLFESEQFRKFSNEIQSYNDYASYNKSTAILKNSINCFPNHPGLYYLLALTYYNCKEYVKANECFESGISYDDKSNTYLGLISCYFLYINDLENAYNYALKAYEINKRNLDAIIVLGSIELMRNNYEESLSYAVIAIEIDDNNFRAIRLLSKIYIAMGVDEKDTLKILYRAKEVGMDEELPLDIIKLLYLNAEYTSCLNECKNTIINYANGYAAEKASKFVNEIYKKVVVEESVSTMENEGLRENSSIEAESINEEYKNKTSFKNPIIESADKIIRHIEENKNNECRDKEITIDKDDNQKKNDDQRKNDNQKKKRVTKEGRTANKREAENEIERNSNSLDEALEKLNSLIGLNNVKTEINRIVQLIKYEKNRDEVLGINKELNAAYHFAFLGNPGTGKTTVARLIGDIFYYLGILEKGHVVEVDRSDIVGRFIGETAKLTRKAIDKAMGGILFIDEAYSLAKGGENSNDYGAEAIETILKAMEDSRGKFTVIFAGYSKEMNNLFKINPGLKSRITQIVDFEDYTEDELCDIVRFMAEKDYYKLSEEGKKAFIEKINIEKIDENFANARCARNILEDAIREKAFRTGDKAVSKEELTILTNEDFGVDLRFTARDKIKDFQVELNNLVGLTNVKNILRGIVNVLELQHRKREMGMQCSDISLNMIFLGNPGTGKTTVARILGKILSALGVLKKGHLVEVTRTDLVGQYVGQTAPKTLEKIKEAYGGILFIDEAYSLNGKNDNDFGKEALATLIKEMEDNRDKLVVIMAGYKDEMRDLMNLNPGLESRMKFTVDFKDYDGEELLQIFKNLCKQENYSISHKAYKKLKQVFEEESAERDKNFGNGREVRKIFENIKMKQANRVIRDNIEESDELLKITLEDVE